MLKRFSGQLATKIEYAHCLAQVHTSAPVCNLLSRIQKAISQKNNEVAPAAIKADAAPKEQIRSKVESTQTKKSNANNNPAKAIKETTMRDVEPANILLSMPRVFDAFEQPDNAELGKFVIIGAANAGKSTLVNYITGAPVSIVSDKPQTTRSRIMASITVDNKQLVFLDTPGVVSRKALRRVSRSVVTAPWSSLVEADYLVILLDGYKLTEKTDEVEHFTFRQLLINKIDIPAILVVNKIDLVKNNEKLEEKICEFKRKYEHIVEGPIYISALEGTNIQEVRNSLLSKTKPANWLVPQNVKSDMSDLMRVEELIRAEWFARTSGHIPYIVQQRNIGWKEINKPQTAAETNSKEGDQPKSPSPKTIIIHQELIVRSAGEAKILIGKDGTNIVDISRAASNNISKALGCRIRLHLQVIIKKSKF